MKILENEKTVGIETFLTKFDGFGGKLRYFPEDFVVKESSIFPPKTQSSKFTIAQVTSVNWETNILVKKLSDQLHISRQRINFAGTKDKRAKTTQLMSFYNVGIEDVSNIKIKDVTIDNIYQSNKAVKIGALKGNCFELIIRNLNDNANKDLLNKYKEFFKKNPYFPNFFGIQRFGIVRPITHEVGKNIINGDFEKAVMTYIANPIKGEDSFEQRKRLQETYDFAEALKTYPDSLNFEKAMLNKLVKNPKDFIGALKELPKNLLTMFVYAYQSYLFNKILSQRIIRKIPINEAILGDYILPIRKGMVEEEAILVEPYNIDKINRQISKGKAVISGILFGSDSFFSKGIMGEIENKIIDLEKIDHRDFIIPDMPKLSSKGSRRPLISHISNFQINLRKDDTDKKVLELNFELKKGSYATSFVREIMKTNDIKNY